VPCIIGAATPPIAGAGIDTAPPPPPPPPTDGVADDFLADNTAAICAADDIPTAPICAAVFILFFNFPATAAPFAAIAAEPCAIAKPCIPGIKAFKPAVIPNASAFAIDLSYSYDAALLFTNICPIEDAALIAICATPKAFANALFCSKTFTKEPNTPAIF
jgi:hypothetical protein